MGGEGSSVRVGDTWEVMSTMAPSWRRARVMRAMLRASSMPEWTFPSGLTPSVCVILISPTGVRVICCENVCRMSTHWRKTDGTSTSREEQVGCGGVGSQVQRRSNRLLDCMSVAQVHPYRLGLVDVAHGTHILQGITVTLWIYLGS